MPLKKNFFHFLKRNSREQKRSTAPKFFLNSFSSVIKLIIFGGGFDARPVVQLAKSLGWAVEVTDECVAHIAPVFFRQPIN